MTYEFDSSPLSISRYRQQLWHEWIGQLNRAALERAERAVTESFVCIETHRDEQTFPWVIGAVVESAHNATAASPPYDAINDAIRFERALKVMLYEVLEPGSTTCIASEITILVPAWQVRVIDVELREVRSGPSCAVAQAHVHVSGPRQRYNIDDSSLRAIHTEMPTCNVI